MTRPLARSDLDEKQADEAVRAPLMRIAISGASGLIGSAVARFLRADGHLVQPLVRSTYYSANERDAAIHWDPESGELSSEKLTGADALVHLAGRNIAVRWTKWHRAEIWNSRVPATEKLCRTLAAMDNPPRTLISASGISYYGDRGDSVMSEVDASGTGFLADICKGWEAATEPAEQAGIRVVRLRIGIVLSGQGGALQKLLFPARLGLSGPIASGCQWLSWIALDDLVRLIFHLLTSTSARGVFNAVSPSPVQQAEFSRTLAKILHRPAFIPMPAFAVQLLFGQMGRETLLASTRAIPAAGMASGFEFRHPDLEQALRYELGASEK